MSRFHMRKETLYVVLGWDSAAGQAVRSLLALGMEVAVVAPQAPAEMPRGVPFVIGSPVDPERLRRAGVERAAGILCALPAQEAHRALAAARALNPTINVVASLQGGDSKASLWAAGAGEVINVQEEAALEMVRLMMDERTSPDGEGALCWARVPVGAASPWLGSRLAQVRGSLKLASVACLWPAGDSTRAQESDDTRVAEGDVLIVLGGRSRLEALLRSPEGI